MFIEFLIWIGFGFVAATWWTKSWKIWVVGMVLLFGSWGSAVQAQQFPEYIDYITIPGYPDGTIDVYWNAGAYEGNFGDGAFWIYPYDATFGEMFVYGAENQLHVWVYNDEGSLTFENDGGYVDPGGDLAGYDPAGQWPYSPPDPPEEPEPPFDVGFGNGGFLLAIWPTAATYLGGKLLPLLGLVFAFVVLVAAVKKIRSVGRRGRLLPLVLVLLFSRSGWAIPVETNNRGGLYCYISNDANYHGGASHPFWGNYRFIQEISGSAIMTNSQQAATVLLYRQADGITYVGNIRMLDHTGGGVQSGEGLLTITVVVQPDGTWLGFLSGLFTAGPLYEGNLQSGFRKALIFDSPSGYVHENGATAVISGVHRAFRNIADTGIIPQVGFWVYMPADYATTQPTTSQSTTYPSTNPTLEDIGDRQEGIDVVQNIVESAGTLLGSSAMVGSMSVGGSGIFTFADLLTPTAYSTGMGTAMYGALHTVFGVANAFGNSLPSENVFEPYQAGFETSFDMKVSSWWQLLCDACDSFRTGFPNLRLYLRTIVAAFWMYAVMRSMINLFCWAMGWRSVFGVSGGVEDGGVDVDDAVDEAIDRKWGAEDTAFARGDD